MNKFWNFFIDNFRITYLLIAAIIIFGTVSIIQMPKESSPEVEIPVALITTSLPGAPAQDVEELVTNPIENQVQSISNIDKLTSSSATGFSQIAVEFSIGSDIDQSVTELRSRVDRATNELPADASSPSVQKVSFSDLPILSLAVSGPYTPGELKRFAEVIKAESEQVSNVSQVNIIGAPDPVVKVAINTSQAAQYGISSSDVINSIQQSNSDIPIGSITTGSGVYNLRFSGRLIVAADIQSVPVSASNGSVVFVRDIATVESTFNRQNVITRLSVNGNQPQSAVSLQIFKEAGEGNILTITDAVNTGIESLIGQQIPSDIVISETQNDAELIRTDLSNLVSSGAITMVIIFILLLAFLGYREAVLASLSIPTTFLLAFIALNYLGYTINFLTLFSLILALGILVDAAIVVTESISSYIDRDFKPTEAVKETVKEFARPLTAGTLTTVFVFFPLLLGSGLIGEFIKSIPVTVISVLLAALFIALAVITTLASRFFPASKQGAQKKSGFVDNGIQKAYDWYSQYIHRLLDNTKQGKRFLFTIAVLFVLALSLPFAGIISLELFPQPNADSVTISVEMPAGTPLEETQDEVVQIEDYLRTDSEIESFASTIGSPVNPGSLTTGTTNSNVAGIIVNLRDERKRNSTEVIADMERDLPSLIRNAGVSVGQQGAGPPQGNPVQIQVIGNNLADLESAALTVAATLEETSGTRNTDSGISDTAGDFVLEVNTPQAVSYGVTPRQISSVLQAAVSGINATILRESGDDTNVEVGYDIATELSDIGAVRSDISSIEGVLIQTPRGSVPVSTFTSISLGRGQSTINHEDGDRILNVTSDITEDANVQIITSSISQKYEAGEFELPSGVTLSFGGEAEEVQESFTDLFLSMIIGILLIFGLLVWQFSSYKIPFIMLATIPLAFIGVFGGLAITFQPLSFPAFIGVVALAGIVVNNAIILIDRINLNKDEGVEHELAIREAAKSRLQPILLTTLTTVGGMIPLLFADPTWAPLANAVIFGLLFSTVLTLVVVPLLYQRFGR